MNINNGLFSMWTARTYLQVKIHELKDEVNFRLRPIDIQQLKLCMVDWTISHCNHHKIIIRLLSCQNIISQKVPWWCACVQFPAKVWFLSRQFCWSHLCSLLSFLPLSIDKSFSWFYHLKDMTYYLNHTFFIATMLSLSSRSFALYTVAYWKV